MLKAEDENGLEVKAKNAKHGLNYHCPSCKEPVSLILDSLHATDHFRHHPYSSCKYDDSHDPESDEHKFQKERLFDSLSAELGVGNVWKEETLPGGRKPDVLFQSPIGQMVAAEIQRSSITDEEWNDRTSDYGSQNIAAMWLLNNMKSELNSLETFKGKRLEGVLRLPLWMRRIAMKYGDTAFDQAWDNDDGKILTGVKLKLTPKTVKDPMTGQWVVRDSFDAHHYIVSRGLVLSASSPTGLKQKLWIPSRYGNEVNLSVKKKNDRYRRENVDDEAYYVECNRPVFVGKESTIDYVEPESRHEAQKLYMALRERNGNGTLDSAGKEFAMRLYHKWNPPKREGDGAMSNDSFDQLAMFSEPASAVNGIVGKKGRVAV